MASLEENVYWVWLAESLGQGSRLSSKLLHIYGNAPVIYKMDILELLENPLFSDSERSAVKKYLSGRDLEQARRIVDACIRLKINIVTPESPEYPDNLRSLTDLPVVLYYRGNFPEWRDRLFVAIVGTRQMSDYGRKIAFSLGYGVALGGGVIVSGMALGSDSMAMAGAMETGAQTIAILGSGVDVIYPREHREMYYKILENGAVISEYPPGTAPMGHHFPVRNRVISGISDCTVVVEGSATSGSLITARCAAEQGRKIFAVPGKVGETGSEGPLTLLHANALPVSTAEDILAEYKFIYPHTVKVDYVHAQLRNINFENSSQTAMEKARIATRGESQYYGTGVYGGRSRDYKNSLSPNNEKENSVKNDEALASTVPVTSKNANAYPQASSGKVKNSVVEVLFGKKKRKSQENVKDDSNSSTKNDNVTTGFNLNSLDENDVRVYNIMQPNTPVLPDLLVQDDLEIGDILSALSSLEIAGLVESSVGGYFTKIDSVLPVTMIDESTDTQTS